jgi:hypothetical protein
MWVPHLGRTCRVVKPRLGLIGLAQPERALSGYPYPSCLAGLAQPNWSPFSFGLRLFSPPFLLPTLSRHHLRHFISPSLFINRTTKLFLCTTIYIPHHPLTNPLLPWVCLARTDTQGRRRWRMKTCLHRWEEALFVQRSRRGEGGAGIFR